MVWNDCAKFHSLFSSLLAVRLRNRESSWKGTNLAVIMILQSTINILWHIFILNMIVFLNTHVKLLYGDSIVNQFFLFLLINLRFKLYSRCAISMSVITRDISYWFHSINPFTYEQLNLLDTVPKQVCHFSSLYIFCLGCKTISRRSAVRFVS